MEKLNKKIIGAIIVLVIFIISIIVYAYICTDVFKTPEQLFGKYLNNNIEQLEDFNLNPYNEILNKLETQNSETEMVIDYTYILEEQLLESASNNVKLSLNIKSDIKNNKQSMSLKNNSNANDLVLLSTLSDENTAGIKVEELYDKYLALENRELKTFFKKIGFSEEELEDIPNKIETPNTEEFTPEELERLENLKNKYIKKISDPIDKTCYSKEKSVQVQLNDENVVADKYVLTINEKNFATIMATTIKEFLADQEFLSLYEGRISEEQIKNLEKENDEYIKTLENIDENSKVNIIIYVKDKKTIRTDYMSEKQEISFEIINNAQDSFIKLTINQDKKDETDVGSETIMKIRNTSTENSGKLECEISIVYNKDDISALNSEINNYYGYENYYEETYEDQNLKFTLEAEKVDENNITLKLNLEELENFEINCNIIFDEEITVEEITDENAVILNDYSTLQLEKLGEELMENALTSIARNFNSSMNPIVTIFAGMYMANSTEEDTSSVENYLTNTTNTTSNSTNNTVTENIITRDMIENIFSNNTNTVSNTTNTTGNTTTNSTSNTTNTTTNSTSNTTNTTENTTNM